MTRKLLKFALLIVTIAIYGALLAQSRIPVTGHFGGVGTDTPNNFGVKFELTYCGANLPRVFGVFNPVLTNTTLIVDPTSGAISGQIWPNDLLICGGVTGGTRYNVTAIVNNVPQGPPACYQVLSTSGTFNLDTAQPCAIVPPPTPPPGTQDAHVNNLTVDGLLAGFNAIFSGDVTALSFHFSTAGNHFACPGGQVANALKQDFTFGCVAFPTAPVTSVFGRTGAVAAAANDYSFPQISGKLANTQTDSAVVYPGTFNKAQIWDHAPVQCTVVGGIQQVPTGTATNGDAAGCFDPIPAHGLIASITFTTCGMTGGSTDKECSTTQPWGTTLPASYAITCTLIRPVYTAGDGISLSTYGLVGTPTTTAFAYYVANDHSIPDGTTLNMTCTAFD